LINSIDHKLKNKLLKSIIPNHSFIRSCPWIFPLLIFFYITGCSPESSSGGSVSTVPTSEPEVVSPVTQEKETHHPFLIVTKNMFPSLLEKSNADPWKSMKEDALEKANE